MDASFEQRLSVPVTPALAWHIYFHTAYPHPFSFCALLHRYVFVKYLTRSATVSIPLLSSLHRTDHTLLPLLLASMSTGQATALIMIATSLALAIPFHHFIISVYI